MSSINPPNNPSEALASKLTALETSSCCQFFILLFSLLLPMAGLALESRPPNILLIMADDVGYNDIHIYNQNPLAITPSIDSLAEQGVRFTRHYTDTVCEPSRTALLTGKFPARLGVREGTRGISLDVMTIADSLQAAGYRTHHVGKWHSRARIRDTWPDRQGFQTYFGFVHQMLLNGTHANGKHVYGQSRYQDPWLSTDGEPAVEHKGHLTELLVENVVRTIESFSPPQQPWFINYWPFATHYPTQPAAKWAAKYPSTREGQYFALVQQLDEGVGRILAALERSGQTDNTLVIFTSDNGGTNFTTDNNAPLKGRKLEYNEGGVRTPLILRWPGHFPANRVVQQPVALVDLFPTLAQIAGAAIPENLDGYDIQPAMHGTDLPPRAQYYQRFQQGRYGYTVLSPDGHWRLYVPEPPGEFALQGKFPLHKVPEEPMLYDLQEDPYGWDNVYPKHPDVVARLENQYRQWHRRARQIELNFEGIENRGIRLTGDDMQRTPGYGGFTFAVSYRPSSPDKIPHGMVAGQKQAWSLSIDEHGHGAKLAFGLNSLSAEITGTAGCNSLIATAHFKITTMRRSKASNQLTMALHHNGESVGEMEIKGIKEDFKITRHATTVGFAEAGNNDFSGILGRPVMLNSYTSSETPATPATLHAELCPPYQ